MLHWSIFLNPLPVLILFLAILIMALPICWVCVILFPQLDTHVVGGRGGVEDRQAPLFVASSVEGGFQGSGSPFAQGPGQCLVKIFF